MPIGDGAGTIVRGQRTVVGNVAAARIRLDVKPEMFNVSADVAPLVAFCRKTKKVRKVKNPQFLWYETDYLPKYITTSGTTSAAGVTLTLAAGMGNRVNVGTLLKNQRTSEVIRVATVDSATQLTVVRAVGGTTGAATTSGEDILIMSQASLEGAGAGAGISSEPPTAIYNYCQTIRQPVDLSGRDLVVDTYGGGEKERILKDGRSAWNQHVETQLLTSNARSATDPTITGGVEFFATTNVYNAAGALTEQNLVDNIIIPFFRKNDSKKTNIIFAGEKFIRALDGFGKDNIRYSESDTGIGINVMKYKTFFGEVEIFQHGGMTTEGYTDNTSANFGLQGYAYCLNLDLIRMVEIEGRGEQLRKGLPETGINAPDVDGWKAEWFGDVGLEILGNSQHVVARGITG